MKKKLLFVVQKLSDGGAERVVSVLANCLASMDVSVNILIYFPTDNEYPVGQDVHKIYLTNSRQQYDQLFTFDKLRAIRKIFKSVQPDFILPFLYFVGMQTQLAGIGLQCKIVQTVRNDPRSSYKSRVRRYLRNSMFAVMWRGFAQNQRQLDYFPKFIQKKMCILPNPVAEEFFAVQHAGGNIPKIIAAGRLQTQKNFAMLIRVAALLQKQGLSFKMEIYGEGPLEKELQQLITDYDVAGCCRLCGRSHDMTRVYSSADVFAMTSNYEGMPNALMEAMAAGLPCVSTDCPTGPAELITNGDNGFLVGMNDEAAMAEAIRMVLSDDDLAHRVGICARESIRAHYSPPMIAQKLIHEVLRP